MDDPRPLAREHLARALAGVWDATRLHLDIAGASLRLEPWDTAGSLDEGSLWLQDIAVDPPGTALDTRAIAALRDFCDQTLTTLWVGPIVNHGFWGRHTWLTDSGQDDKGEPHLHVPTPTTTLRGKP